MATVKLTISYFILSGLLCVCQHSHGQGLPPEITSTFDDLYLQLGNTEKKELKCVAQNGKIKYTWKKDGVVVPNSQIVGVNETSGVISFLGIESADFGTYQCYASNDYGTAVSKPFKVARALCSECAWISGERCAPLGLLFSTVLGQFSTTLKDDVECKPYELCSVECAGKPKCTPASECKYEWKIGEGTDDNVQPTKRIAVGKNGYLHFLYLDPTSDITTKNGLRKVYGCGIWNEVLKLFKKGGETTIKVTEIKSTPSKAEPAGIDHTDDKVQVRGQGQLTCIFKGYPVPDIEWLKPDNTRITTNDKYAIEDYGRRLVIRDAEERDEGEYKCLGNNPSGMNVTMRPYLNVTSAPFLRNNEQMNNQIKPAGSNATFSCDVISLQNPPEDPPSPPKWYKNGEEIPSDQIGQGKNYTVSADKKVLTVLDVKKGEDTGNFLCESYNSEGTLYKDALLKVIDPIDLSYPPEGVVIDVEVSLGDSLNLGVFATTDPNYVLRYDWEYQAESSDPAQPVQPVMVDNNPYWTLFNGRRNLSIDTTVFGDEEKDIFQVVGHYRVKVHHQYESKMVTFNVFTNIIPVVVLPQNPTEVQSANLWYLAVIFGIIFLIIVIILIICMLFRNKGGVYLVDKKEVAAGHDPERELRDSGFHDLSRGDDEDNPKMDQVSLSDDFDKDVGSDDDSMADYDGDLNASKFNEDGSFIGLYGDKKSKTGGTTTV